MCIYDEQHRKIVEKQFVQYCMKVLKNEACDIQREFARQKKYEKSLEDLTVDELMELAIPCTIQQSTKFTVCNNIICVQDEALADALKLLNDQRRELILLYFFLNKTDQEIATLYNMVRQTVSYQRKSTLKRLREYLEMEEIL